MQKSYVKTVLKSVVDVSRIVTVHYYEFGPQFSFEGESHDFWELVYVDKGKVAVRRDEEEIILGQGEIVLHRPNEFHSIRALDSAPDFFVISFVTKSSAMAFFEGFSTHLDPNLKRYVSLIIKEAEKTYVIPKNQPSMRKLERKKNAPLGGEQLIKTYLEQFLIFLLRQQNRGEILSPASEEPRGENVLARNITEWMQERLGEKVTVEDICQEFGYSRSYLSSFFRKETGESLVSAFSRMKIDRAKAMIRSGEMNFSQISTFLGFETPQYFARVFKRFAGMTPTEFKNRANTHS